VKRKKKPFLTVSLSLSLSLFQNVFRKYVCMPSIERHRVHSTGMHGCARRRRFDISGREYEPIFLIVNLRHDGKLRAAKWSSGRMVVATTTPQTNKQAIDEEETDARDRRCYVLRTARAVVLRVRSTRQQQWTRADE